MLNLIKKIFPNKKDRDIKQLLPIVDSINEEYAKLKDISDDDLRGKTLQFKEKIQEYTKEIREQIAEAEKNAAEELDISQKDALYNEIDELKKQHYEQLDEIMEELAPEAFAVVKETARRFTENGSLKVVANDYDRELAETREHIEISGPTAIWKGSWLAADAKIDWHMIHYDVQLMGGTVLHQGKIAEMATGEGKTLVATLPVYLNAITGMGVDFGFLDLRLGVPDAHSPTWTYTGTFAESYVLDIPDLPLILQLIRAFEEGADLAPKPTPLFERYCLERGISPYALQNYLKSLDRYFEHTFGQLPNLQFVGFTVWATNYFSTLMAAAHLKRRSKPPFIIAGGPQVTSSQASGEIGLKSQLFDIVALGEGEQTLLEVYEEQSRTGSVSPGMPGTLSLGRNGAFVRAERPLLKLTALPAPDFSDMDIEAYQREWGYRVLPLQFSRGCTDRCSFCSEWAFWERFRPDVPEHVIEHIKELQATYGANFILFVDSLLNGVPKRLTQFAQSLLDESIDVYWSAFMRARMDNETAALLYQSGCHDVFVGIESFSDETLEMMKKRRTKADNIEALEAFLSADIDVTAGFIPGFPGDRRSSFLESARVLREVQHSYPGQLEVQIEPFVVQANAPIYNTLTEVGLSPVSWAEDYLDIAPAYRKITSKVLCSVEGDNQGIERLGRVTIVKSLGVDEHTNDGFTFLRAHEEHIGCYSFYIEHLFGVWSLAQIRSENGHVYGLLTNDDECGEFEELQTTGPLEFDNIEVQSILKRIEAKHIVRPSRSGFKLICPHHGKIRAKDTMYSISPYIIARKTDNTKRSQILTAHVASGRWKPLPPKFNELIELVAKKQISRRQLSARLMREHGITMTDALWDDVRELIKDGIIIPTFRINSRKQL